jgi:predicted amino acid-binding ACT domain protein
MSRLSQHASAAELVRSMTRANRVNATHIRTVLAHVDDQRGVLEALLDDAVLRELVEIDITREASTVEAFACQILGTSFHGLTFSLRPSSERSFPSTSVLTLVEPGRLPEHSEQPIPAVGGSAAFAMYDTARRSTSIFDGVTTEEFLVQLPQPSVASSQLHDGSTSFRDAAVQVTGLARSMERPLSFIHAPVATPVRRDVPRGVTGSGLRFGVSFPQFDDSLRLSFGTKLVGLCCDAGYGLWQRTTSLGDRSYDHGYDYWQPVVPPPASTDDRGAGDQASRPEHGLAVTCVGPARPGTTEAVLRVLAHAGAPLLGLSATTLDDIAIIHLFTRTPLGRRDIDDLALSRDLRADTVLSTALDRREPLPRDTLRDYRAVVSSRPERPPDRGLAAVWVAWTAPATADALRLTVETLRAALDSSWARHRASATGEALAGHLNIEYLVCREVSADRLRGRMRVAVDLDALGLTVPGAAPPGHPEGDGGGLPSRIGRFCSDLERQWRTSLSFALRTTQVELDVVWRESWLGRWTGWDGDSDLRPR